MRKLNSIFQFYLIADSTFPDFLSITKMVLPLGITCVQLRMKTESDTEIIRVGRELKEECDFHGIPLLINDHVHIARKVAAAGIHIGQKDMSIEKARNILVPGSIIGVSAHNLEEAKRAFHQGASYVGCGALYPTRTKHDAQFVDMATFRDICHLSRPVLGIGGLDEKNFLPVIDSGAAGVCFSSAIYLSKNPEDATKRIHQMLLSVSS